MLQFNNKAGAELFKIKLISRDTQLFADCFCLIQGKNPFLVHNIRLITDKRMNAGGRETKLLRPPANEHISRTFELSSLPRASRKQGSVFVLLVAILFD
jgi:hypothetical protein